MFIFGVVETAVTVLQHARSRKPDLDDICSCFAASAQLFIVFQ